MLLSRCAFFESITTRFGYLLSANPNQLKERSHLSCSASKKAIAIFGLGNDKRSHL
ncbi:hypothetical protein [Tolypothrix sp. VBCCA 56010]|uniref:hypothetical protein n=1 Tax=Tolypothrix sp. VBCCA 56010 TaxID=3137731 RepID=UPI003D7CD743